MLALLEYISSDVLTACNLLRPAVCSLLAATIGTPPEQDCEANCACLATKPATCYQGVYSRELKSYVYESDYFGALRKHLQTPNAFWGGLRGLNSKTLDPQVSVHLL